MRVLNYLVLLSPLFTTGVSTLDDEILAKRFLREETPAQEVRRDLQETAYERVCFDVEYANGAINVVLVVESQEEPTPDPTACVEGATEVYEDGEWITIRCPYSCSPGCTDGVYVHLLDDANGVCTSGCVTAAELMSNGNYTCGLCPFT